MGDGAAADGAGEFSLACDRGAAREARRVVRNVLLPYARALGAELAPSCPFNPEQDHLLPHESQKRAMSQHQWQCAVCSKKFKSEHYMDMHMERKHSNLLASDAPVCLSHFCDVLQCPSWVHQLRQQEGARPRACKEVEVEARRHVCSHLMHDCFLAGAAAVDMHHVFELMEDKFCRPLSCVGRREIVEHGSSLGSMSDATEDDGPHASYYVLGGALLLSLAVLYVIVLCSVHETRFAGAAGGGDLRARRGRRTSSLWGAWFGPRKVKAF